MPRLVEACVSARHGCAGALGKGTRLLQRHLAKTAWLQPRVRARGKEPVLAGSGWAGELAGALGKGTRLGASGVGG